MSIPPAVVIRCALLASVVGIVSCGGGGSSGSGITPQTPLVAPSNLVYPQATLTLTVGQAFALNAPAVTGTVTSYSISPTLPGGLALNSSTGAISGTPTSVTATATYTVTAANSAGSTTASLQITVNPPAPTNLIYPQTTIILMTGQALTAQVPTVTGTVSAYSISPALPAGLTLNSSTGAISGTPTTVTAIATYTVTATNAGGSTTAQLQITVNPVAPSSLTYPASTILATVGQRITPAIPVVTGTVTAFTVSPVLPAGLAITPSTGMISGTPTTVTATATYTVTATNAGGNTTAPVSITVRKAPTTLLELGHGDQIEQLRVVGSRVFSKDSTGHWVLWDYDFQAPLADGDPVCCLPAEMKGATIVIGLPNGLEVRSSSSGQLLATIVSPGLNSQTNQWWQLASDGSYISGGSPSGLVIWSPTGQTLLTRSGDYSLAKAFAAPGEVRIALGPAGANVVETISLGNGSSSTSPPFSGNFHSWLLDGERFFSNLSTTVWIYSKSGAQQGIAALASLDSLQNLAGEGNWFWTFEPNTVGHPLSIYAVGSNSPTVTYNLDLGVNTSVIASGNTLGVVHARPNVMSIIDLSGVAPAKSDHTAPVFSLSTYAATSASRWLVGNEHGVIFDGAAVGTPRYFGLGAAWSIAGADDRVAVSTATGPIFYFNPASAVPITTIGFPSSKLALSKDGVTLVAAANANDFQHSPDRTLKILSMPSGTLTKDFPYTFSTSGSPTLFDFTLALSTPVLARVTGTYSAGNPWTYTRQVSATTGGPIIWEDQGTDRDGPIFLSPDGTLIAESRGSSIYLAITNIFKNGALTTAVPGVARGWVDDSRILVQSYIRLPGSAGIIQYDGSKLYSPGGAVVATPALPELSQMQMATADLLYSPDKNAVFSLSTGQTTWKNSYTSRVSAVSGPYVIFAAPGRVLVDTY